MNGTTSGSLSVLVQKLVGALCGHQSSVQYEEVVAMPRDRGEEYGSDTATKKKG